MSAIKHMETDRIPIDFGGSDVSTIMIGPYKKLAARLGIDPNPIYMPYPYGGTVDVKPEIAEALGSDTRHVPYYPASWKQGEAYDKTSVKVPQNYSPKENPDGSLVLLDANGREIFKRPPGGQFFFKICYELEGYTTVGEITKAFKSMRYSDRPSYSDMSLKDLENHTAKIREKDSKALVGGFCGHIFQAALEMRGFEAFLLDLVSNPKVAEAILENITNNHIMEFEEYASTVGTKLDIIQILDDLGTQSSLWMNPEMYRKMIKPHHKRFFEHIKKTCDASLMMHSDGAISQIIPDFIEIGVDILNPVQYTAAGMNLSKIKKTFGKDLTLWGGGIDTQSILPFKSPEEVREEVKRNLDILSPDGGFVFATVHNILDGVPSENIEAAFNAVLDYGKEW